MQIKNFRLLLLGLSFLVNLISCSTQQPKKVSDKSESKTAVVKTPSETPKPEIKSEKKFEEITVELPSVNREFRAVWIASVANINWPSSRNLTTEQQKAEAVHLLDLLKENNFNAVIFQARPSADALYDSPYEPWSYFLTGETGKAPYPYYDPLKFWIEEAHKRGLELHVWLNPYRAHHSSGGKISSKSMVYKMSDQIVRLKNGMYWFDPASQATQDHVSEIVMDIVRRYDIDGIHFDDYFYPYASYNGGADFPDQKSFDAYKSSGGTLSKSDWRRENVNLFIKRIYTEIKAEKNYVKFGISPFGIWKPGYPYGVSGLSQYDELYADAKLWLNKGWIDYFTPQLYWPIDAPKQSFTALLQWWESENTHERHIWPGLNTVEIKSVDKPAEIVRQIELTRQLVPRSAGAAHWSIAGLTQNPLMLTYLKNGPYKEKALIPQSTWLQSLIVEKPMLELTIEDFQIKANWKINPNENLAHWILYKKYGDTWETEILAPEMNMSEINKMKGSQNLEIIAVRAVDRIGNESEYTALSVI